MTISQDSSRGSDWARLEIYGFSACEAMKVSPIPIDRRMNPQSPRKVRQQLGQLVNWHKANRQQLKKAIERERPYLEKARRELQS